MEIFLAFFKSLPQLITTNRKGIINILIVISISIAVNFGSIKKSFTEKDIVVEYTKKAFQIETSLKIFKNTYHFDEVSIAILHNGVVSIVDPNFHLMKYSILFSVGDNSRIYKSIYIDQPLSVWIDNVNSMVSNGKLIIPDLENSEDPLVRNMYKSHKIKTQIYLPMYKEGLLIGIMIGNYKNKTDVTPQLAYQMKRSIQTTEARL